MRVRPAAALLALVVVAVSARRPARGEDARKLPELTAAVATDAVTVLARALVVLAAERGPDAARDVLHEPLPPSLARAAEALRANPRIEQLRVLNVAAAKRAVAAKMI